MRRRRADEDMEPPPDLLNWRGAMPFYPDREWEDPVVVAAMRAFHQQLEWWCEARAQWSGEHGWPDGDAARIAEEQEMWAWDPCEIWRV
jgi:hypothetical protein